ncbi:LysR family transcriptional regulator [Paraburkholderia sp. BCC1876]|uniref:LysR family transcriptional regulator n=1 Tax=Paraburkholderia sp. BCC1876 TaxID=2676303 RepID=UPI00158F9E83|nr:LysR family transcriptional regulator [Paraburkholderia sp. BCC1876]
METLANLQSFVKSAESGSFSEAGRRLGLTAAAVSRNMAMLERNLGVRLFQRSTRGLTLTEAGVRFLQSIGDSLETLQAAIEEASSDASEPTGVLKVSLSTTFGIAHVLPLLPEFLQRYPRIRPEWHFESRRVDLVQEGYDLAIGGGFAFAPGIVARTLAPAHIVAVASPEYLRERRVPMEPAELAGLAGIAMRASGTGRIRQWTLRNATGMEATAPLKEDIVMNDPGAMREAARLGLGVAMLALPDVVADFEAGTLVRVLPDWYADAGSISIYYASRTLLPAKTRAFADFIVEAFGQRKLARKYSAI